MFHQVINYQDVSVTFAIIIGVALQEYNICHMGYREPLNVIMSQTLSISTYTLLTTLLMLP